MKGKIFSVHVYSEALISMEVSKSKCEVMMSMVELCRDGILEGVKDALQRGTDVNTKDKNGRTGLMQAVGNNHNSVVALLLNRPNIDVNLKSSLGNCALLQAVRSKNSVGLRLLLEVPTIDVNIVNNSGWSAVHVAVIHNNIGGLKMLLNSQFSLTAQTLNQTDNKDMGVTPVMLALAISLSSARRKRWEHLEVLVADPRVDLDTTDRQGRSLEEVGGWVFFSLFRQLSVFCDVCLMKGIVHLEF